MLNPNGKYVGDGEYCLISVADPGNKLREGNNSGTGESNNWASVRVKLSSGGSSVTRYNGSTCAGVATEPWNTLDRAPTRRLRRAPPAPQRDAPRARPR